MPAIATCSSADGKSLRELPYLAHTGYELVLMLDGRKKLANMYFEYPPHRHPHEDQFDRKAGLFLKLTANPQERKHILPDDQIKNVNALLADKIEIVGEPQ
jgi:hypothetical protein